MGAKIAKEGAWYMKKRGKVSSKAAAPSSPAMTLRDEAIAVLREELGEGFEAATFETLCREYTLRGIKSRLQARRVAAVGMTAPQEVLVLRQAEADFITSMQDAHAKLVTARQNAKDASRSEQEIRNAAVEQAKASVETELGTV